MLIFLILFNLLLGVFAFGLFATDIFVNAGQVVTGHLTPYFLTVCKPNYTSTDCQAHHQFVNNGNICTGDLEVIEKARRSFPSKHAALSIYSALYATVSALEFYCLPQNEILSGCVSLTHTLRLLSLMCTMSGSAIDMITLTRTTLPASQYNTVNCQRVLVLERNGYSSRVTCSPFTAAETGVQRVAKNNQGWDAGSWHQACSSLSNYNSTLPALLLVPEQHTPLRCGFM